MNTPIRRLAVLVAAMFCALMISSSWIQAVQARSLDARPDNHRTLLASYARERGSILVGGDPVATSTATKDDLKWLRIYPKAKEYSHLTGYYSFIYGSGGGIEGSEDTLLSGQSDKLFYRRVVDIVSGKSPQGANVELTINPKAQRAAEDALGSQRGAAVALDPRTGAILALVSHPEYDPGLLTTHNLADEQHNWQKLLADEGRPLIDRVIGGDLYPPGSTFKLVVTAAALSSGRYTPSSVIPGPARLALPQTTSTLPNDFPGACGPNGKTTLAHALQISCNTAYGWLGLHLKGAAMRNQAEKFGFGQQVTIPMTVTPSSFPATLTPPQLAQSAIGQYDVRVTPLQIAMISAAIADKGKVMQPYLVKAVRAADLSVIASASPTSLGTAVSPTVAAQLTTMMESVVDAGTGTPGRIPGVRVAGKTGTAEHGAHVAPDAWFTAFAPADNPQIAVAVVVEDGGKAGNEAFGGTVAAPIAKKIIEAVIQR